MDQVALLLIMLDPPKGGKPVSLSSVIMTNLFTSQTQVTWQRKKSREIDHLSFTFLPDYLAADITLIKIRSLLLILPSKKLVQQYRKLGPLKNNNLKIIH